MEDKEQFEEYEEYEDNMDIASKEEIIDSYEEELDDDYNYEPEKKPVNIRKIINIVFVILMLGMIMIATDVICVARYNVGPFFTIPLNTYKDGGTKEYYGLGYKVIKYNQLQGRRDKEIGLWTLKYNVEPITLQDIDLAIEFNGNEVNTYKKYYKKFVRVISTLKKVDQKNKKITLEYLDEDGKYTMEIVCKMVKDQKDLSHLVEGDETTIIGTVYNYKFKTNKTNPKLYIKDCFAEQ